jgi:prepilin-type N-terminal cleavage/methylation domain-containing protein
MIMQKRKGFTLIELLVVIAIIALLMAILMPALGQVRKQAKAVTCLSNMHQWADVWGMYTGDHDGYFNHGYFTFTPANTRPEHHWPYCTLQYYKNKEVLYCPEAREHHEDVGGSLTWSAWGRYLMLNNEPPGGEDFYGSYGQNYYICNGVPEWIEQSFRYWRHCNFNGGNMAPIMMDATRHSLWPTKGRAPLLYEGEMPSDEAGYNLAGYCIDRHNGFNMMCFADFSARPVGLKELWSLDYSPRDRGPSSTWNENTPENEWPQWMNRH